MPQVESIYAKWNPWHGCTKLSAGCKYCYVYRQDAMYGTEEAASVCRKTASFDLPVKKKRDGSWKLPSGKGHLYLLHLRLSAERRRPMAAGLLGYDPPQAGLLLLFLHQAHRPPV